jgi:cytochrome c oxidase accessory protein FixG
VTVVIDTVQRTGVAAPGGAGARPSPRPGGSPGLYKKREPIHPKLVHGRYRLIKWALLILTLGIYYVVPWLRWDRPGALPDQAVMVDFAHGRFYFFFIQLWAEEVYYVTGLMVLGALALFLVSSLFGRLWCGYACPQTVWTDLYIAVERLFEGDRNARLRLDKAPWSFDKAWRKLGKHAAWVAIAAATGGAWVFYFGDAPTLWRGLWRGEAPATAYVSVVLLTFTTYWLAGWMREQVCTFMCPWPRIQGAMLDAHSLQVTYRYDRGEPRGAHKKGADWTGRGDCVDCKACVVACPMGIDIRDGLQLECINCGLCIDACDEIMGKVGRPRALIAYDTDAAVAARARGERPLYRLLRGRTAYYGAALVLVSALMTWGLVTRPTLNLEAQHDRNPVFVRMKDGSIRNGYTLKLSNRGIRPAVYEVSYAGPAGARVSAVGLQDGGGTAFRVEVQPSKVRTLRVFATAPAGAPEATDASFRVRDPARGEQRTASTVFLAEAGS